MVPKPGAYGIRPQVGTIGIAETLGTRDQMAPRRPGPTQPPCGTVS